MIKSIYYLCTVGGSCQHFYFSLLLKYQQLWPCSFWDEAFFIPGSSQVLPVPKSDYKVEKQLSNFPYTLANKSVSNDFTVSTYDLQAKKRTLKKSLADNASGMCRKGMVWNEEGQSGLTN